MISQQNMLENCTLTLKGAVLICISYNYLKYVTV